MLKQVYGISVVRLSIYDKIDGVELGKILLDVNTTKIYKSKIIEMINNRI